MYVLGTNPDADVGYLFFAGAIGWASLVEYLSSCHSEMMRYCSDDDREGVNAKDSLILAEALERAIHAGEPNRFVQEAKPFSFWADWSTSERRRELIDNVASFANFLKHCGGYTMFEDFDYRGC